MKSLITNLLYYVFFLVIGSIFWIFELMFSNIIICRIRWTREQKQLYKELYEQYSKNLTGPYKITYKEYYNASNINEPDKSFILYKNNKKLDNEQFNFVIDDPVSIIAKKFNLYYRDEIYGKVEGEKFTPLTKEMQENTNISGIFVVTESTDTSKFFPGSEYPLGTLVSLQKGLLHNDIHPAVIIRSDGKPPLIKLFYYNNGNFHRLDGPAVMGLRSASAQINPLTLAINFMKSPVFGPKDFFVEGKKVAEEEFDHHPLVREYNGKISLKLKMHRIFK